MSSEEGYRMVRKTYLCHMCDKTFRQMAPVLELVQVECPECHQTFCEEQAAPQTSSPQISQRSESPVADQPPSPILGASRPREPTDTLHLIRRRRVTTDQAGRSTIVEDILTGGQLIQRSVVLLEQQPAQIPPPTSPATTMPSEPFTLFFNLLPSAGLDLNFRSTVSDDTLLHHIMRLSEL